MKSKIILILLAAFVNFPASVSKTSITYCKFTANKIA